MITPMSTEVMEGLAWLALWLWILVDLLHRLDDPNEINEEEDDD